MSDNPTDYREQLNIREQIARIDRNHDKIQKLFAEARKFNRDPWFLVTGVIIAAIATRPPEILQAFGH
jgi:hypothetical protein